MSATQGVVFALGGEKRFGGLVTQDSPRCLLDLGFQPMAWYALRAHGVDTPEDARRLEARWREASEEGRRRMLGGRTA